MALRSISVQLYSVRTALESDPSGTIGRLAEIGLRQVEAGYKYLTRIPDLLEAIRANGLSTPTLTSPLFENDRAPVWELANRLGAHTVIDTFIPEQHWSSVSDIDHIAAELNDASREASAHDLRVGYHNHWWELETQFGGVSALELLIDRLDPAVILEVDAYWVAVGGADPVAFVERHAERIRFLHLKDGPISRDNLQQRSAGNGVLPIHALLEAATVLEAGVIEFDDYDGDVFEAIAASFDYLAPLLVEGARS